MKNESKSNSGGYQMPSAQNDTSANNSNFEEGVSLFDIRKAGHPVASFFTFIFKVGGIFSYLFLNKIRDDYTMTFIFVILAASCDFWTVKNITGRLLVGLRWWSEIQEDGTEKWHFESHDQKSQIHPIDKRVFWWSQTIACIFWALMTFWSFLQLHLYWMTCSGICLVLSAVNYWGYYKCSKDQQKRVSGLIRTAALDSIRKGFGFGF